MQRIAERLKQLRENAYLKQKDVAEAIGVGLDAYKSYETGRRSIPADVLREAAKFYGFSMVSRQCLPLAKLPVHQAGAVAVQEVRVIEFLDADLRKSNTKSK